jgi:hypothetical protein
MSNRSLYAAERASVLVLPRRPTQNAVFLNIPYDKGFRTLYLAYIVGLVHLGFEPRATLGLPGGTRRLDKIIEEIQRSRYSIHDLSRTGVDRNPPFATPRFNMPFELGLVVTWAKLNPQNHSWFLFEAKPYRIQKSLSDMNGTDPHVHDGLVLGVMRELNNAFERPHNQPTVPEMMSAYRVVSRLSARIVEDSGAKSLFEAKAFRSLCYAARLATDKIRISG